MDPELPLINGSCFDYRQCELFSAPKKDLKKCQRCKMEKPFSAFGIAKWKLRQTGEIRERHLNKCKSCRSEEWSEQFANDPIFRKKNQERFLRYAKERRREKNPLWKLKRVMAGWYGRHRLESLREVLGYGPEDLQKHLESLWEPWMSWHNYATSDGWQIDHIRECKTFNLNQIEEFKQCHSLLNLRPLRTLSNIGRRRGKKLSMGTIIKDSLKNNSLIIEGPWKESSDGASENEINGKNRMGCGCF